MTAPGDGGPEDGDANALIDGTVASGASGRRPLPTPMVFGAGLLMGAADAVPGVSGGTIALIVGIYRRFIAALATALRLPLLLRGGTAGEWCEWGAALRFLLPLGGGILLAYYLVTRLLVGPTDDPGILRREATAPICYGFFFGLVLLSLWVPWLRIATPRPGHFAAAALGAAMTALLVGRQSSGEVETWMLLYGGVLAISAMLLPGISGALVLVVLGHYTVVAAAAHDGDVAKLAVFAVGAGVGMFTMVPLLRHMLRTHHDTTMAVLTGLMAGSLRALWPWKENYDLDAGVMTNVGIGDSVPLVLLAAVVGGVVVWLLMRLEQRIVAREGGFTREGKGCPGSGTDDETRVRRQS